MGWLVSYMDILKILLLITLIMRNCKNLKYNVKKYIRASCLINIKIRRIEILSMCYIPKEKKLNNTMKYSGICTN